MHIAVNMHSLYDGLHIEKQGMKMKERKKIFRGDRLKQIREVRGFTQDELESRLKLGNTTIYRYEKGDAEPSPVVIGGIARELEVTADYLLGLVDDPSAHLEESELSSIERKLLSAFRRGDLRDLMKIASEEAETEH
jgi:transcriptional regulator with XRE-family HTH domain